MNQSEAQPDPDAVLVCGAGAHREFGLHSLLDAGITVGVIEDPSNIDASSAHAWLQSPVAEALDTPAFNELLAQGWGAAVCWGEFAMDTLSTILEHSTVRGPQLEVRQVRDKFLMRQTLASSDCRQPFFRLCVDTDELLTALVELGSPMVVKPIDYAGSAGVRLVASPEEALAAQAGVGRLGGRALLCEEYLDGPEYSCEVLMISGQGPLVYGVTEKFVTQPPAFFELGHAFPAYVDSDVHQELIACAVEAARTLGVDTATVHVELKWVDGRPYVVEVAGRLGGDEIPRLVSLSTGLNPFVLEAEAVLGHLPDQLPDVRPQPGRAVSVCLDAEPGQRVDFTGVRRVLSNTPTFRAREARAFIAAGTVIPDLAEGRMRVGQLVGTTMMGRAEVARFIDAITSAL